MSTREKLLKAAQNLFWTRGYSNVSVRDITRSADVDVALVSRYFGGKQGLFEATLKLVPPWEALAADGEALLLKAVKSFSEPHDPRSDAVNPFTMLLSNVNDPEMGDMIRDMVRRGMSKPLAEKIGGRQAETRAAMLLAVLFGAALMRKSFQVDGFQAQPNEALVAQLMHLARAALAYDG